MLTEVSLKAGVDEARLRLWRQWPFISDIQPESGPAGSIVVIDGGNLGTPEDTVEVYFQDRLARMIQRTSTRLTVEMPRSVTGSGSVIAKVNDQRTNTKPWRAHVVDLVVQTITLKTPGVLRVQQAIAFQATLINQGTLSIPNIPVRWIVTTTSGQPPIEYSLQARPVDDDFPTLPRTIIQENYLHGPLKAQETSTDPSLEFTAAFTAPGTYWVSVIIDPDNTLQDQSPTNNRFMLEFVVQPALPPPPEFNSPPNQFTPKSGRPGDRITLQGRNFNQGSPMVLFGTVQAAIISTSATQIVVRVPSISPRTTSITVQTSVGTVTTQDSFTILSSSYYGSGQAIGGNLL
nr:MULTISPECIES: IPT/TIG domain-containing protein [unclassified Leptolyngbya]